MIQKLLFRRGCIDEKLAKWFKSALLCRYGFHACYQFRLNPVYFLAVPVRPKECTIARVDALHTAAASGLRARMESLEMLANNIANASTPGYKADREFYSTYIAPEAFDGPEGSLPVSSPVIETSWTDFKAGVSSETGNTLDFAINENGFFTIGTSNGVVYTRNGSFRVSAEGNLVNQLGDAVLDVSGKPIHLDPNQTLDADARGNLQQAGRIVAQLGVVDFDGSTQLRKLGTNYFRYAGPTAPQQSTAAVSQGRLENANLEPAEAAVRLVSVMRQFEMLQRALSLGSEMNRRAVEEVARVKE